MFDFLKALFSSRTKQREAAERERARIKHLVAQHRTCVKEYITKELPPPPPVDNNPVNRAGMLREATASLNAGLLREGDRECNAGLLREATPSLKAGMLREERRGGEVRFSIGCSNYGSTQTYLE